VKEQKEQKNKKERKEQKRKHPLLFSSQNCTKEEDRRG
jgi:hypothetical protein